MINIIKSLNGNVRLLLVSRGNDLVIDDGLVLTFYKMMR